MVSFFRSLFVSGHDLSERVRDLVFDEQDTGQIFSSLLQLGVIAGLFIVWLTSPKAHTGVNFEAVPLVCLIYLPYSLWRVYRSLIRKMSEFELYLSSFMDIVSIVVLVWLYHLQYMQDAGFSLRAPTFVYLHMMIVMRALNYKPQLVLFTGALATAAWTVLTAYAAFTTQEGLTHNFIEYSLSHKVLLGAEVEKILSLIIVTLVLAFANSRSLKMLISSATSSLATKDLSRFFNKEVATHISDNGHLLKPGYGHRRMATVLTVDLRGFTKMTQEMSAEDVLKVISEYHDLVLPYVFKHGGCVDKFLGDGILIHFGAVKPSDCYAADCLRAIEEIHFAIESYNDDRKRKGKAELNINMAVATGEVIFGTTGSSSRLEFTIIGDAVNLASKMEKMNKTLGSFAVATERTASFAKDQGFEPKMKSEELKGITVEGAGRSYDLVGYYK